MIELMNTIFDSILKMHKEWQKEYAQDEDNVFANFERVAYFTKTTREKALLTYMIKHIDGLCAYADGHSSQREYVRGMLTDIIVYCILFWGMVEDNKNSQRSEDESCVYNIRIFYSLVVW